MENISWTNEETKLVALWVKQDLAMYNYSRQMRNIFLSEKRPELKFSNWLKGLLIEIKEEHDRANLAFINDLLQLALNKVDFKQIAQSIIADKEY